MSILCSIFVYIQMLLDWTNKSISILYSTQHSLEGSVLCAGLVTRASKPALVTACCAIDCNDDNESWFWNTTANVKMVSGHVAHHQPCHQKEAPLHAELFTQPMHVNAHVWKHAPPTPLFACHGRLLLLATENSGKGRTVQTQQGTSPAVTVVLSRFTCVSGLSENYTFIFCLCTKHHNLK